TWGLVVNEAMASGLPVLVSDRCGCASDLVVNGRNGFIFDPFDVGAMSEFMLRMSGSVIDLAAMGAASRQIIANWSPATWAENLQSAINAAHLAIQPKPSFFDRLLIRTLIKR